MDAPDHRPARVEEASLNAWPALHQVLLDGWVAGFTAGFTRRANAVTPLYAGHRDLGQRIDAVEALYARQRLRPLFRLPRLPHLLPLDEALTARGYDHSAATLVLWRDLRSGLPDVRPPPLSDRQRWLEDYGTLTGEPAAARQVHGLILRAIRHPSLFACSHADDGQPLACAFAVVEDDLVGLFDVVTAAPARRRGLARDLVSGLLASAAQQGAQSAYLQVEAANEGARALYAGLGFEPLYSYLYRAAPAAHTVSGDDT